MRYPLILLCAAAMTSPALAEDDKPTKGASSTFEALDKDSDGKLTQEEVSGNAGLSGSFEKLDSNSDGFISKREFRRNTMPKPASSPGY